MRIVIVGLAVTAAWGWCASEARAGDVLAPKLIAFEAAQEAGQMIPPAEDGQGVTFVFNIEDPAQDFTAYHADVRRVAEAAAAAWSSHLDGDARIEVRVTFNGGDGTYIMAAGPILVQTGTTVGGAQVWQAGPIWEIRGNGDPNGGAVDADLLIAPDWLDQLHWGYPDAPPADEVDAYATMVHEFGHVLGFLHLEEYYTGDGKSATTYDIRTRAFGVGHEYAGDQTIETYGSAVPLADILFDADRSHVALDDGEGSLMYPFAFPGVRHPITAVEVAILADAGMPVKTCVGLDGGADTDTDGDGVLDCDDNCPQAANASQADADGDGTGDACDACPADASKSVEAGVCGCGMPDLDTDGDGVFNCADPCPLDGAKVEPGVCGCGADDDDADGDGAADCDDDCPLDADKLDPGACGCGKPETDTDGDGTPDCVDGCPDNAEKTSPGAAGCADADGGETTNDPSDDEYLTLDGGCGAVGILPPGALALGLVMLAQRPTSRGARAQ